MDKPEQKLSFIPSPYFQTDRFKFNVAQRQMKKFVAMTLAPRIQTEIKITRHKPKWYHCRPFFRYALWTTIGFQWGTIFIKIIQSIWLT